MNKQIAIALFAGTLLANKINAQKPTKPHHFHHVRHSKANVKTQYGVASFYANKFNGRRTANGEIFSQQKLTAASNTVPLNTWVKVVNMRNRKTVVVRITDRMHFRNKRLIDLSKSAARQLGYTGWGLAKVRVEVIGKHAPVDEKSTVSK